MTIRIAFMSDIHIEMERQAPDRPTKQYLDLHKARKREPGHPALGPWLGDLREKQIDLLVLAGDIDTRGRAVKYAETSGRYLSVPVVLIGGNHESGYGGGPPVDDTPAQLRELAAQTDGRVTFLERESKVFNFRGEQLWVLGSTLWTDFELFGASDDAIEESCCAAQLSMNDYRFSFVKGRDFTPWLARDLHFRARQYLADEMSRIRATEGAGARILVATHMSPVADAVAPRYRDDRTSAAYASHMSDFIEHHQPDAWIWGHCHREPYEGRIGRTFLRSATRGYVGIEEPYASSFKPQIVEIGDWRHGADE